MCPTQAIQPHSRTCLSFRNNIGSTPQRIEARHIARGFDAADAEYIGPVYSVWVAYFNRLSQIVAA